MKIPRLLLAMGLASLTTGCAHRHASANLAPKQHSVKLTWKAATGDVSGYHVYRTGGTSGWTLLKTVGPDVTETTDDSVASGATYRYKVRAFEVKGGGVVESADSGVVTASVPD